MSVLQEGFCARCIKNRKRNISRDENWNFNPITRKIFIKKLFQRTSHSTLDKINFKYKFFILVSMLAATAFWAQLVVLTTKAPIKDKKRDLIIHLRLNLFMRSMVVLSSLTLFFFCSRSIWNYGKMARHYYPRIYIDRRK